MKRSRTDSGSDSDWFDAKRMPNLCLMCKEAAGGSSCSVCYGDLCDACVLRYTKPCYNCNEARTICPTCWPLLECGHRDICDSCITHCDSPSCSAPACPLCLVSCTKCANVMCPACIDTRPGCKPCKTCKECPARVSECRCGLAVCTKHCSERRDVQPCKCGAVKVHVNECTKFAGACDSAYLCERNGGRDHPELTGPSCLFYPLSK